MQEQIRKAFEKLRETEWNQTRQSIEKILMILFERHHLLRTRIQEGIFSIHGSLYLDVICAFYYPAYRRYFQRVVLHRTNITKFSVHTIYERTT
jgi:hypothetical protein